MFELEAVLQNWTKLQAHIGLTIALCKILNSSAKIVLPYFAVGPRADW